MVGFDVTGVRDAVGDAGAVVAPGDVDALASALVARLDAAGPGAVEGVVGRQRAVQHFDHRRSADAVAELVRELHRGDGSAASWPTAGRAGTR